MNCDCGLFAIYPAISESCPTICHDINCNLRLAITAFENGQDAWIYVHSMNFRLKAGV